MTPVIRLSPAGGRLVRTSGHLDQEAAMRDYEEELLELRPEDDEEVECDDGIDL